MKTDNRVEDFDAVVNRLCAEINANGGAVKYVVTIEKHEKIVEERQGDWYKHDDKPGSDSFTYAPSYPQISEKKITIFSQVVSDLDITGLVKAVNGIEASKNNAN